MGCEAADTVVQEKQSNTPRLPLLSLPPMPSPDRSGTLTPPLHAHSAAVPFRWEQLPGKPIPSTALLPFSNPKSLELPPSRILIPSPTTVFDGPYVRTASFRAPSFSNTAGTTDCYGSFGAERGLLGAMILSRGRREARNRGGWFGSWRKRRNSNKASFKVTAAGGSHVFPSSADHNRDAATISNAKSRVWSKICEGLKQAVPWRSKKLKKEGSALMF